MLAIGTKLRNEKDQYCEVSSHVSAGKLESTQQTVIEILSAPEPTISENPQHHVQKAISLFRESYVSKWYHELESVPLSSWIDPTVFFIGSHISVMKPWLVEREIPEGGIFMHQPCIRTRSTNVLFDDEKISKWGSYFPSLGSLVRPNDLLKACTDAFSYLESMGVKSEDILLRVSSKDQDLLHAIGAAGLGDRMELDSKPEGYYRHRLWMLGIYGRNFNIAIRHRKSGVFNDIGNIILIENAEKQIAVETAIGVTTTLCEIHGLEHFFDTSPIKAIMPSNEWLYPKMKDCIISSVAIMREWELPVASQRWRVLRTYLRGLIYFREKLGLDSDRLLAAISGYEQLEFWTNEIASKIFDYIETYEASLRSKKELSAEDSIIKKVLYPINK